ncbi:hypothetical protein EV356DRAFT_508300 [Viridothelium virens]|uniref:Uncharacterized protein n=1 Tax=Viridothelium virens TaxID=1048519 RepID=A0A6A6GYJ8_VIRVR|nr:hypothetical protein EV356DRAFT_508300 [Viridothelium virens]
MPPQAGMQAFKGCHRAWSQAAYPTYEQEAAAQKGECDHADDEEYIVIVQWRDRHSGEAFKDPARATENLKPEIWQTHFLAELDSLADHGVSRTERSVDWEEVALPVRRQSQSQALLQLSRSHSLSHSQSSHSRSRSRSHSQSASQSTSTPVSQSPAPSAGALSRSQSLRQRARSSSFGRDRSAGEPARTESFDARVRSVSLGERHGSLGEVRDEEVGLAVEQRQSLNLCEMAKFQFEVESDDEYEEEEVVGEDTKVAGEVETAGRDRADSGLGLSNGKVIGLGGIREEEEDEAGELRERGDVDVGYCTPTPASSSQVASARAKLEEGPRKSESEARGPVPIRGSLIDDAREKFEAGLSRPKRYSSMLRKDEEEKQGVPKGPGLSRTKTLPAQARDSLKLELTKSRMERMSQVH